MDMNRSFRGRTANSTPCPPSCGSTGTIPLLAAWAGHGAFGSDLSASFVTDAAENLAHFGREATLACVDAREATQAADCIVTNVPHSVYSHLAAAALPAILRNLGRLAPRLTLVATTGAPPAECYDFSVDEIIELYRQGIDGTLLEKNLRLSPEERLLQLMDLQRFAEELRRAGQAEREARQPPPGR